MPQPSQPNDNLPGNDLYLTDAERAAREGFDDDGNEVAAAAGADASAPADAAAGDTPAGDATTDAAAAPAGEGAAGAADPSAAAATAAAGEQPAGATAAAGEQQPSPPSTPVAGPVFAPRLDPGTPRDFAAELKGLKEKYNAGELDDDAYETAREEVIEARTFYKTQSWTAEQISQKGWEANVNAFLQLPENATLLRSEAMRDFWVTAMGRYVNEAASAGKNPADWEILSGGRDKLFQEMGLSTAPTPPAPAPANPTGAPPAAAKPPVRAPDLSNIPPAVGAAPNAGATGAKATAESLAGQDIFEIEKFMAGQSEEQQEAILRTLPGAFADS